MTQEQKQLLLIDLCSRLPYGVKVSTPDDVSRTITRMNIDRNLIEVGDYIDDVYVLSDIKPYLFPLSSMTDEQCEELNNLIHEHFILDDGFNEGISFKTYGDILVWLDEKPINECYFIFDYFNKNHLDYRGLISMSLALDATGINIY